MIFFYESFWAFFYLKGIICVFYGLSLFRRLINDYCRFDNRMECGRIVNGIVIIHGSTKLRLL